MTRQSQADGGGGAGRAGADPPAPETTLSLLEQVRAERPGAMDRLMARVYPELRRWAHGRVPGRLRGMVDTGDLVQICLSRSLDRLKRFEPHRDGALIAYLRRALINEIRDQLRRQHRRPELQPVGPDLPYEGPSPLEEAVGREALAAYEVGLSRLTPEQQAALILRVELGYSYPEIAREIGLENPNAARMRVVRAMVRLAEVLDG